MPKSIKKKAWRFEMAKKGIRTVTRGRTTCGCYQHGDGDGDWSEEPLEIIVSVSVSLTEIS